MRKAAISRKTNETDITVKLNIDGTGAVKCNSGNGFFDHMINSFGKHADFDLEIECKGDTFVDFHHSAEDIGIVLGQAFADCTTEKKGIQRFGSADVPMDEALVSAVCDISGRPFLVFNAELPSERAGEFESELAEEFFRAFAMNSMITLHINQKYGKNTHHILEAIFKSTGRALSQACKIQGDTLRSTKGVL